MDKHTFSSLSDYMDLLLDAICVVNRHGQFLNVSAGAQRVFGYAPEEMIGLSMIDMVHPEDRAKTLAVVDEIMAGEHKVDFENRYLRKNGEIVHLLWSARWSEVDDVRVAVARDISKSKRDEAMQAATFKISEAAHTEDSLLALYRRIHQIVAELMPAKQFAIALYDADKTQLNFPYKHIESNLLDKGIDLHALSSRVSSDGQTLMVNDQTGGTCDWLAVPLRTQNGVMGAVIVQTDNPNKHYTVSDQELLEYVSTQIAAAIERKQMLERLQHLALYDQLTGLPNRQLFHDRIKQVLARAHRNSRKIALFYLDLDKFKQANDSLGHETGDLLLSEAARRLVQCVREIDTVARLGGDEFVVLLDLIADPSVASQIAEKMRETMAKPFILNGLRVEMSASIGIALFPQHGSSVSQLLNHADKAMYHAKRLGGNQFHDCYPDLNLTATS